MKIFTRCNLPKQIKYNKKTFYWLGPALENEALKEQPPKYNFVEVQVLQRNLRGRDNLHGKPYQPSRFIFGSLKQQ